MTATEGKVRLTVQQRAFLRNLDAYPDEMVTETFMQTARELRSSGVVAFRAHSDGLYIEITPAGRQALSPEREGGADG